MRLIPQGHFLHCDFGGSERALLDGVDVLGFVEVTVVETETDDTRMSAWGAREGQVGQGL